MQSFRIVRLEQIPAYSTKIVVNSFTSGELSLISVIVTKKKHVAARGGLPRSVATTVTGYVT